MKPTTELDMRQRILALDKLRQTHQIDNDQYVDGLLKLQKAAVREALTRLKKDMEMHTVPEGKGLITRSYLNNSIDFELAKLEEGE